MCVEFGEDRTATLRVDWWARWNLKPGWRHDKTGIAQQGAYCQGSANEGVCKATFPSSMQYDIIVVFKRSS